jgi:hypothetical protein
LLECSSRQCRWRGWGDVFPLEWPDRDTPEFLHKHGAAKDSKAVPTPNQKFPQKQQKPGFMIRHQLR